ncbi:transcription initiation factor TFIID subunit 4B isoform X2 [Hyperolius riggenbachi]|uniref:transcription initiation factor TFIID subunit 4B isoform X2 n=1 Tax=Hyperolius riggenbachi TaxID=752182 RepID=UPI0035A2E365
MKAAQLSLAAPAAVASPVLHDTGQPGVLISDITSPGMPEAPATASRVPSSQPPVLSTPVCSKAGPGASAPALTLTATQQAAPPRAAQATIQLPANFQIPPGTVLIRSGNGQLMLVSQQALARAQAQVQNSNARSPASSNAPTVQICTVQSPGNQVASNIPKSTVRTAPFPAPITAIALSPNVKGNSAVLKTAVTPNNVTKISSPLISKASSSVSGHTVVRICPTPQSMATSKGTPTVIIRAAAPSTAPVTTLSGALPATAVPTPITGVPATSAMGMNAATVTMVPIRTSAPMVKPAANSNCKSIAVPATATSSTALTINGPLPMMPSTAQAVAITGPTVRLKATASTPTTILKQSLNSSLPAVTVSPSHSPFVQTIVPTVTQPVTTTSPTVKLMMTVSSAAAPTQAFTTTLSAINSSRSNIVQTVVLSSAPTITTCSPTVKLKTTASSTESTRTFNSTLPVTLNPPASNIVQTVVSSSAQPTVTTGPTVMLKSPIPSATTSAFNLLSDAVNPAVSNTEQTVAATGCAPDCTTGPIVKTTLFSPVTSRPIFISTLPSSVNPSPLNICQSVVSSGAQAVSTTPTVALNTTVSSAPTPAAAIKSSLPVVNPHSNIVQPVPCGAQPVATTTNICVTTTVASAPIFVSSLAPATHVITTVVTENNQTGKTLTSIVPLTSRAMPSKSEASSRPQRMQPPNTTESLDNVKKCKNFLATLIKLASSGPQSPTMGQNVKNLVKNLLDSKLEPEEFTTKLYKELKSSPQPYLVPFLKKSLPSLRRMMPDSQEFILQCGQPNPPPPVTSTNSVSFVKITPTTSMQTVQPTTLTVIGNGRVPQSASALPQSISLKTVNLKQMVVQQPAGGMVKHVTAMPSGGAVTLNKPGEKQISLATLIQAGHLPPAAVLKQINLPGNKVISLQAPPVPIKENGPACFREEDDINDVTSMAGVNLNEENACILATNSEFVGAVIRSCKDEPFLFRSALHTRILDIGKRHDIKELNSDVVNLVSHATQERLRGLIEKLTVVAHHRITNYKQNDRYVQSSDVRAQLKFLEQLEHLERQRRNEEEREMLLRAAKWRANKEDPEQLKLKQKAKELQQLELEQIQYREANIAALAAIGPRKKRPLESSNLQNVLEVPKIASTSLLDSNSTALTEGMPEDQHHSQYYSQDCIYRPTMPLSLFLS